jgi:hypothetical protein
MQHDLQEDSRAGDRKANNQVFDWAAESEQLDIMERSALSEMKEETSKAQPSEKTDDGGMPGLAHALSGNCSGRVALRREHLGSNHRDN